MMNSKCDIPLRVESSTGKSLIVFAFFSFLGLSIWFTPLPNAPEVSCDRPCHELDWPRICRLKFVLESHTISDRFEDKYLRNCSQLDSQCLREVFLYESGSKLITVNRQILGPKIHVCVHDILLVDVVNRLPGNSATVHWRGQTHRNDPLMNGAPMINQCPISSFTTFQYKFRASDPGTHTWHLHNDDGKAPNNHNNIYGLMVVRESRKTEPHNEFVDLDESNHTIILRTVRSHQHQSMIFINGKHEKSKGKKLPIFEVVKNKRHRFRVAHAGGDFKCLITVTVENHKILVIALDGNAIEPIYTAQFTFAPGERLDFVLWAENDIKTYDMQFKVDKNCNTETVSRAVLNYVKDESKKKDKLDSRVEIQLPFTPMVSTAFDENCNKTMTCLEDINSLEDSADEIRNADVIHYLFYNYNKFQIEGIQESFETAQINNISFIYPSSPLASQISDVPQESICNKDNLPNGCVKHPNETCFCTHIIDIQLNSVVEILLIHFENNAKRSHIFHLHGHKFVILGRNKLNGLKTPDEFIAADKDGKLVKRNVRNAVKKDTIVSPPGGVAVLRFVADNPGYWLLREEGGSQGMEIVFNVIGSQYNVPETFPRCGNWVGPKYFFA